MEFHSHGWNSIGGHAQDWNQRLNFHACEWKFRPGLSPWEVGEPATEA